MQVSAGSALPRAGSGAGLALGSTISGASINPVRADANAVTLVVVSCLATWLLAVVVPSGSTSTCR